MNSHHTDVPQRLRQWFAAQAGSECDLLLDLGGYAAGELDAVQRQRVEDHLAACPACREDLAEFERMESVWDAAAPDGSVFARWIRTVFGAALAGLAPRRLVWGLLPVAVVLLLAVVVSMPEPAGVDRFQLKGSWMMHVAARRAGRAFRVVDGMKLRTGDQLGFFYSSGRNGYLMIVYADESGDIVVLVPADGRQAIPVQAGSRVRLADGAELSPGSGCEWVIGLFALRPVNQEQVRQVVREALKHRQGCDLPGDYPPGWDVQVLRVMR